MEKGILLARTILYFWFVNITMPEWFDWWTNRGRAEPNLANTCLRSAGGIRDTSPGFVGGYGSPRLYHIHMSEKQQSQIRCAGYFSDFPISESSSTLYEADILALSQYLSHRARCTRHRARATSMLRVLCTSTST